MLMFSLVYKGSIIEVERVLYFMFFLYVLFAKLVFVFLADDCVFIVKSIPFSKTP